MDRRPSRRATLWLLVVTMIWGASFLWTEEAMDAAADLATRRGLAAGALTTLAATAFVGGRFALAWGVLTVASCVPRLRAPADGALRRAAVLYSLAILSGFLLQTFALGELDAAVSAFLTSAYVSLTALLTALIHRRLPRRGTLAGIALATFGAGFIDGPPQVSFGLAEWLTLLSALIFAGGILLTDHLTRRHDPVALTRVSMGFVTFGAGAVLAVLWRGAAPEQTAALLALWGELAFWRPLLLNALLANVAALLLINLYQRELDPVRAAILYSLEPVWTAVWVLAFVDTTPSPWLWVGGGTLLAGNLVAELSPRRRQSSSSR
ncbi:MAG: DMT family transporter [Planctomycetota bacterium]